MPDTTDYYAAPDQAAAGADNSADKSKPAGDDEDKMDGDTALLPKSIFGDSMPDVGATCTFKVEHVWEDEVEVSYVKSGDAQKPDQQKSNMDSAADAFDSMAKPDQTQE